MNQFQSSLYMLTESVGAVSMVNIQQIVRQQNLDYLEHLCTFVDRMNLNPIWFENEETSNKLKIMQIYQLAITYSKNLTLSYKKQIEQKEANLLKLRNQQKQKVGLIRDHKDNYLQLKERYKMKKHQIYKYTYDILRNKLKEEQQGRQYHRGQQSRKSSTPQIIYYYPQQNDHMRFDTNGYPPPHHYPNQYHHYPPPPTHPPQQPNYAWPSNNPSHSNTQHFNPFTENHRQNYIPPNDPQVNTIESNNRYNQFLDAGNLQTPQSNRNLTKSTKINIKLVSQHSQQQKQQAMQNSQIIASGQKILKNIQKSVKQVKEQIKLPSQKSMDKSNRKRQSIRLQARQDEDQFGDLTANSKKREGSIKLMERNSDMSSDQGEFDSIAHIKLATDNSNKNIPISAPNRFQSKIHKQQEKNNPPPSNNLKLDSGHYLQEIDQDFLEMGLPSNIMKSKFSKNSKQAEGQKLFDTNNPPKRNSQNRKSAVKNEGSRKSSIDQTEKSNKNVKSQIKPEGDFQGEKLYNNRPKRNNSQEDNNQLRSIVKTVELSDKGVDLYHSNVGKVETKKVEKQKKIDQSADIFTSNRGSGNSKASGEKIFTEKPKRASQIEAPQPQIKKSKNNNELKVSVAQSQSMKNSNQMLHSQAFSMKFSKDASKTPPKLQKQQSQKDEYDDDFEDMDIDQMLQNSHLPISHQKAKEVQKSEVKINIEAIATNKEITKEKYVKLANQTFQLKKQNTLNANNAANLLRSSNTNLVQSDNFFDQILQIPMNSKIAKRPSGIQNKFQSKIHKKISSQQKKSSIGIIQSPSIHIIDPAGHMQKVQERGFQQKQKVNNQSNNSVKMQNSSNKSIDEKIDLNSKKNNNDKAQQRQKQEEDEQIQFDLMEQSSIGNKQGQKKVLQVIHKIQTQPSIYKDSKKFDDKIFDKIIFDKFKIQPNAIKAAKKWQDVQLFFKRQNEKIKIEIEQRSEHASTPKNRNDSFYDQLEYSQSNLKMENKSFKNQGKKQKIMLNMKDTIQRNDAKPGEKIQSQPQSLPTSPKNRNDKFQNKNAKNEVKKEQSMLNMKDTIQSVDDRIEKGRFQQKVRNSSLQNKYSRGAKPKTQVKDQIRKNISEGKNAYDIDDPLNIAVYQNKKLLQKKEDSDDDF